MTKLVLGIDIGTSGVRTAVLDQEGAVIGTARIAHEWQDPDHIDAMAWWRAVQVCIRQQGDALQNIGRSLTEIGRIGVDGTSGTLVLTNERLQPVTRGLMYNSAGFDTEAAIIADHAPATHIAKGANSALARALHLQQEDTDKDAAHVLHQADFVAARLMGRGGISDHNNTLKLGFDPEDETWPDWFDQTGLRVSLLPQSRAPGTPIAPISPLMAQDLGFAKTAIIHAGTTDSIAAFLAAAPLTPGAAVTSLGTTLAIKIVSKARIDDPQIGLYSHKLGNFWLAGGASNTGGGVLAALFTPDELGQLSKVINPEMRSDLDYYPLLKPGERFPFNDPAYPPLMTPRPERDADFLHGLLESMARIEAKCYEAIAARGGAAPRHLYTAGGGAANVAWTKIRARVIGIQPKPAMQQEAAVGVARLII